MERVAFSTILRQAWGLLDGHDYSDTNAGMAVEDFRLIRDTADLVLPDGWQYYPWPQLTTLEYRRYRPAYSAAENVVAGDERFFIQEQKYYQALVAQSPAAEEPADALGVENSAYWAESKAGYVADDYVAGAGYDPGDQVYYPTTGRWYQNHTATVGNPPTHTGHWGVLTEFDQYVLFEQAGKTVIGSVDDVFSRHPVRDRRNAVRLSYRLEDDRVAVLEDIPAVWLELRGRCPRFTGDAYASASTYVSGDQVYYEATGQGDFWIANQNVAVAETPVTDPAKWDRVEVPRFLQRYLVAAIYDALRVQYNKPGRPDRAEFPTAYTHLDNEIMKLAMQGQRLAIDVMVR